jgi:DNA-binding transcriptional ArsR family regulator
METEGVPNLSRGAAMKGEMLTCEGISLDLTEIERMSQDACKTRLAQLSKGLAHPARVEIVRMLENKPLEERCVCGDIVNALPLAQSSVSQHLKVLKETGWIQGEIDGPRVCYCTIQGISDYYLALINRALHGE